MIDLGRQQTNHGAEALTALEELRAGRVLGPVNGQPHTAYDWRLRVFGVGDHFQAGDAQVDALGGVLGCGRLVQVLLDLAAHRPGIDDRALHGPQ